MHKNLQWRKRHDRNLNTTIEVKSDNKQQLKADRESRSNHSEWNFLLNKTAHAFYPPVLETIISVYITEHISRTWAACRRCDFCLKLSTCTCWHFRSHPAGELMWQQVSYTEPYDLKHPGRLERQRVQECVVTRQLTGEYGWAVNSKCPQWTDGRVHSGS